MRKKITNEAQILKKIILKRKARRKYANKKIPNILIKKITKLALHSPSSYGFEPWYIIIIKNQKLKEKIYQFFNKTNQQVLFCSHLFLIMSLKGDSFNLKNDFFWEKLKKEKNIDIDNSTLEERKKIQKKYKIFEESNIKNIDIWARNQCFILLQNFLLIFTSYNINTCPIGGFNEKEIINYLENKKIIQKNKFNLAVTFSAGYPEIKWKKEGKILKKKYEEIFKLI